jgi:uncharacterized protein involved in response to NO
MNKQLFDYPLFTLGFKAFFMLAALAALVLMVVWKSLWNGDLSTATYYPEQYWHGHEMLLGYTIAVIAGFLLTVVKDWTGLPVISGGKLAGLCLLWLYGRILPFYADLLPHSFIALVDLSFLPVLAYFISRPLLQTQHFKHLIITVLLLQIALGNAMIHLQILGIFPHSAIFGFKLVLATMVMMILFTVGHLFPIFLERGLTNALVISNARTETLALVSGVMVFVLQLFTVSETLFALAAIFAVIIHSIRLMQWYDRRIWYVPLLWILYVGYGWMILGFGFMALHVYNIVTTTVVLHAFASGGIGVLTLGMMARVSLGYSGRALRTSNVIALAFVLLNLAAFAQVVLPALWSAWTIKLLYLSSGCWLAAFALFLVVYSHIFTAASLNNK